MPTANDEIALKPLSDNLWLIRSPLPLVGADVGRNTAIIRLDDELLIHSTAPLSAEIWQELQKLGKPAWVVESTLYHDTFTAKFATQHPDLTYFLPDGFKPPPTVAAYSFRESPPTWAKDIETLLIAGVPSAGEYAFLHRPSRTLIVADLIFNVSPNSSAWVRLLLRALSGLKPKPGMSRLYRQAIQDRAAFSKCITQILEWDFDRVIVGHGDPIMTNGKEILRTIWREHGYL